MGKETTVLLKCLECSVQNEWKIAKMRQGYYGQDNESSHYEWWEENEYNPYAYKKRRKFPNGKIIFIIIILLLVIIGVALLLRLFFNNVNPLSSFNESGGDIYCYYEALSLEEQKTYDKILTGIKKSESEIELEATSFKDIERIINMIYADHPEVFWVKTWSSVTTLRHMTLSFEYQYTASEVKSRQAEIEHNVKAFLEKAQDMPNEYEKIKSVYEYILDTVEYVGGCSDNQNLYSSLVNHKSVCAGYAKGTQYLLQRLGIQAIYVSGTADENGGWDNHAWNIVRCEKNYYQVDTTFGDGLSDTLSYDKLKKSNVRNYAYLCRDDNAFSVDHKRNDNELPLPKCTTDDLNYYKLNGMYSSTYDESVDESMKESILAGEQIWMWQLGDYDTEWKTKLKETYMEYLQEYSKANSMWYSYSKAGNLFVCGY